MDAGFDPNGFEQHTETSSTQYGTAPTPEEQKHRSDATTAFVISIVGDVLAWFPLTNIASLVLSILAVARSKKNRQYAEQFGLQEAGMNIAARWCGIGGIIVSALGILFCLLVIVLAILAFAALIGNVGVGVSGVTTVIPEIF